MKKLLYVLTILCLLAGLFVACEKPNENEEDGGGTITEQFASIQGKVTDKETGNPLSDATIELQPTGKQVKTTEDGSYILNSLKAGTYTLKAQKDGYKDCLNEGIQLVADQTFTLNVEMEEERFEEIRITDWAGNPIEELECYSTVGCFIIINEGDMTTEWHMETEAEWITGFRESGRLEVGDADTLTFRRMLQEEDKETVIIIKTDKKSFPLRITSKGFVMELVYVEGGEFEMGATEEQGDDVWSDEKPVRTIRLDGYHIGKYEVTQAQWKAVMGTNPSHCEENNLPVESVSWEDAREFCQKLSEATGKKYVLPTEAQWEFAARGGNKSQHYKYSGSNDINEVAWYDDNSDRKTHLVGMKKANELGIYDMSGNVAEWCSDWYGDYDENDTENPLGAAGGAYRVDRGGSWLNDAESCRVSNRNHLSPVHRGNVLGFRVAVLP